jgi:molybdopterin molybdotransferase
MISLDDAFKIYCETVKPLRSEKMDGDLALGRVVAAPIHSLSDLPIFTQSAVDGYAVRHADCAVGASFNLVGEQPAGPTRIGLKVSQGQTVRIFTGAPLPDGADTVIRQEYIDTADGDVLQTIAVDYGADVRYKGEEITLGAKLVNPGHRLTPGLLGAIAMAGVDKVEVTRQPRIAILITGDEVKDAGEELAHGEIYDANTPMIDAWLRVHGYRTPAIHRLGDDQELTKAALSNALDEFDLVVTTGGVSVGDYDFIPETAAQLGVQTHFWKVSQMPGKPLYYGTRQDGDKTKVLLGLPGNPGAVLVGMILHIRYALDLLEGVAEPGAMFYKGVMSEDIHPNQTRTRLMRMVASSNSQGQIQLDSLPKQQSHMLSNLALANALVRIEPGDEPIRAGSIVSFTPLNAMKNIHA